MRMKRKRRRFARFWEHGIHPGPMTVPEEHAKSELSDDFGSAKGTYPYNGFMTEVFDESAVQRSENWDGLRHSLDIEGLKCRIHQPNAAVTYADSLPISI